MAVTAKFLADFSSFQDAVQKAEVQLRSMETGAGKVETSLNKMVDALSGRKLIQDATLSAEAVERIGGVTKLTSAELQRLGAQAQEAAAKLKAMGQDVPQNLQNIADAAKKAEGGFAGIGSSVLKMAGSLGIGLSVGAIVSFGKSVFDTASNIHDMAEKLGISVEAVQGFKFASEQAGSSLDAVGIAINKMNANLSGGDKSTIAALGKAGLEFQSIRNMKPEDAFLAIADAIQKMPDPMEQSEVALKLFGKSASELLPAIKEGFRAASDGADKMSTETVNSLERAQDAWGKLADKVTIATGTIIANILKNRQFTAEYSQNVMKFGADAANANADFEAAMNKAIAASGKNRDVNLTLAPAIHKTAEELAAEDAAAKKATDAIRAHAAAVQQLADKYSGAALARQVKDLSDAMRTLKSNADFKLLAADVGKLFREGANLTPEMLKLAIAFGELSPKVDQSALNITYLGTQVGIVTPKIDKMWDALNQPVPFGITHLKDELAALVVITPADMLKGVQQKTHDVDKAIHDLAQTFAQLAQIAGGSLGSIIADFGELVGAVDTANKSIDSYREGKKAFSDGDKLSGVVGMSSGILGIASAAIAAGKAIANLFDRNKGRDVVVNFANSMGGFDVLQHRLETLGDAGAQLWKQLTQGVGRNNPAQAKAAIDAITAALGNQTAQQERLSSVMEKYGLSWEEAGQKAKQAHLDEISQGLIQDFADLSVAGFDVTLITEKMGDAINDYIHLAMKTGTEVPEAMRPLLAKMVEMGTLTDANGDKITDLEGSGISFAETMTQGFTDIVDAIHELTRALGGVPKTLDIDVNYHQTGWIPDSMKTDVPVYGSGAFVNRAHLAVVGDQPEYITPTSSVPMLAGDISRAMISGGGTTTTAPTPIIVQTFLDGRQIAEATVRYTPDVLQSYGLN